MNRLSLGGGAFFVGALSILVACSDKTPDTAASFQRAIRCSGHADVVVTATDYFGTPQGYEGSAMEHNIGHPSALELVSKAPNQSAEFAAAWFHKDSSVLNLSIYNAGTKTLTHASPLPYPAGTQKWVRRLGHERDTCTAIAGTDTCGWITWADTWGYVNWVAIGSGGQRSYTRYVEGHAGSGDIGWNCVPHWITPTKKKLLAYISSDRSRIEGRFIDPSGISSAAFVIHSLPTNWFAYQTAVAWSGRCGERWVISWTEQNFTDQKNGRVKTAYVTFNGTVSAQTNHVMYCEGPATQESCSGITRPIPPPDGGVAPDQTTDASKQPSYQPAWLYNQFCVCKGLWMSASGYRKDLSDVFRVFVYNKRSRLNYSGTAYPVEEGNGCSTYCPVGMVDFTYDSERSYFTVISQMAPGQYPLDRTRQLNMKGYEFAVFEDDGLIHGSPYEKGQAIRTLGYDANNQMAFGAALAGEGNKLALSLFNTKAGGCPP